MAGCLTPLTIYRRERGIKDNHTDVVPCGKCPNCLKRRVNQWSFRLRKEQEVSISSVFLTLTYSDENLPFSDNGLMTLDKTHHQKFMKRLRKHLKVYNYKYRIIEDLPLKYYAVGEYGTETHRPHFHSILFNLPDKMITDETIIENIWGLGRVQVAICNDSTIAYVAGYVNKRLTTEYDDPKYNDLDDRIRECSMMSKGLGKNFLTKQTKKFYQELMEPYMIIEDGKKLPMPRYFKYKIFNDFQKKILAEKSKKYAEENYPYRDAKHEVEHVKQQFKQHKKNQILKRKSI